MVVDCDAKCRKCGKKPRMLLLKFPNDYFGDCLYRYDIMCDCGRLFIGVEFGNIEDKEKYKDKTIEGFKSWEK